jgi:hypothetical protein
MAFYYHTEYSVGREGRRVCRTHNGFRAVLAILVDLSISMFFGVFSFAFWLVRFCFRSVVHVTEFFVRVGWSFLVAIVRFLVAVLEAPVTALRAVLKRIAPEPLETPQTAHAPRIPAKRAIVFDEV